MSRARTIILFLLFFLQTELIAQSARNSIDNDRMLIEVESEDAYDSALDFLRRDSTYYIGWLYLGASLHARAADLIGYQKCVLPLLEAKMLIEKDYGQILKTRTLDEAWFFDHFYRFQDYNYITYFLSSAYSILEKVDSVFWIANSYQSFNLQKDLAYYNGPFISKAWTTYRYRNMTKKDFDVLGESLEQNMVLVHEYLDSSNLRIQENVELNDQVMGYMMNKADYTSLYHLESIIYAYEKEYAKAEEAYSLLEDYGMFSSNNYALLKISEGEFEEAFHFFDLNRKIEPFQKSLEEWIYYEGILNSYRHDNKSSINTILEWIKIVGSTPGYGWYNLALARSYIYNGDIESAKKAWTKAKNFTEYHIGTTLGEKSYEQTLDFLSVLISDFELKALKFENPRWFFSWNKIGQYIKLRWRLMIKRWKILNDIAGFEDREKLIYDMFSGESSMGWYDILHTLKSFSVSYFVDYYQGLLQDQKTPMGLRPYYRFALASLYKHGGQNSKAREQLDILDSESTEDLEFNRLLHFFALDAKIELGSIDEQSGVNDSYRMYPELLPFTNHRMRFQLEVEGDADDLISDCVKRMKKCRIDFVDEGEKDVPKVIVKGRVDNDQRYISVDVSLNGKKIMDTYKYSVVQEEDGIKMAYAIFSIFNLNQTNER